MHAHGNYMDVQKMAAVTATHQRTIYICHLKTAHGKHKSKARKWREISLSAGNMWKIFIKLSFWNNITSSKYTYSYLTCWVVSAPPHEPWHPKNYELVNLDSM